MADHNLFCEYHDGDALAKATLDEVVAVLNRGLQEYDRCRVDDYGRERLREAISLIHVEYDHEEAG